MTIERPPSRTWRGWVTAGWIRLLTLVFMASGALILVGDASPATGEVAWWLGLVIVGAPLVIQTFREVASGREPRETLVCRWMSWSIRQSSR